MRKVKQYIASLLIFVMTMSMCLTAFAGDGSITIENTSQGETYDVYKIFDLTYAEPLTPSNAQYNGKFTSPVSYTFTGTEEQAALLNAGESPFEATESSTPGVYNISLKEGKKAQDVVNFFSANDDENLMALGKKVNTAPVEGNGAAKTVEGLDYGYYYIKSSLGATVTIDSTLPNVTVVDKNEDTPSWDNAPGDDGYDPDKPGDGKVIILPDGRKATESTANYGDTVKFSIAVNAKALVGNELATYYYIKDELGAGFSEAKNITVTIYPVGDDGKYSETASATPSNAKVVQDGNKFAIQIPFGLRFGSEAKIEVTYEATVKDTDDVVLGSKGNPNTASFLYDLDDYDPDPESPDHFDPDPGNDDPDDPDYPGPDHPFNDPDPDPDDVPDGDDPRTTKTYVYALDILKYDAADSSRKLAGAKFKLEIKNGTDDPVPVTFKADNDTAGKNYFDYDEGGTVTEFITNDEGIILLKGLAELPEGSKYVLTEIEAPNGYNKLKDPVELQLNNVNSTKELDDNHVVVPQDVPNNSGVELPSTGGRGTTLLLVFGSIIALMTGLVLVTKKRMYNEG